MPKYVLEVLELSRGVVKTKRDNAKLVHCAINLKTELANVHTVERLAFVNLEVAHWLA